MSSETPVLALEASNRGARASLDGVTTRSTASILNATRYYLVLPALSPYKGHFLSCAQAILLSLLLSSEMQSLSGDWISYCTQLTSSASVSLERSNKCGVIARPLQLCIVLGSSSRRKRKNISGIFKRSDSKQPKQSISMSSSSRCIMPHDLALELGAGMLPTLALASPGIAKHVFPTEQIYTALHAVHLSCLLFCCHLCHACS